MAELHRRLERLCAAEGLRVPSRGSLYAAFDSIEGHAYDIVSLPPAAAQCLYNLPREGRVSGRQLVFYCLNYGSLTALSFAAGLPWLDLHQARRLRGWRTRSRGLLEAVLRVRGR